MELQVNETELQVKCGEVVMVRPCFPSPKTTLYLSNLDDQPKLRFMARQIVVYKVGCNSNLLGDPAKVIRQALSKVLVHYYPIAGRLRSTHNGKLQVECNAEGVPFMAATSHNTLSVLGDCDDLKPSFHQLISTIPFDAENANIYPLVLQVTRFSCGGFVLGYGLNHSICDGLGIGQFLNALGEMARGFDKLSVQPIWDREFLKPRNPQHVMFQHSELVTDSFISSFHEHEEFVHYFYFLDSKRIKQTKQLLMEECNENFSSFDIGAALVWRAMTKAYKISDSQNVKLMFAMNSRKLFKPPVQNGYYGNCFYPVCATARAEELHSISILLATMTIKRSKLLLSDEYLRSGIDFVETSRQVLNEQVHVPMKNVLIMSDWRFLGSNTVDFGWGYSSIVSPIEWSGFFHANFVLLLPPPKGKDGIKILVCMPQTTLKLFAKEMEVGILANSMKKDSQRSFL
ncbi:hypothetical protein SUGI_1190120 [Cryptomeria japonica]|uniref:taxadien-5-alpha-ol O-acetyltransferase-like n=1 Tax=Cryptomeria japonica TaxID=3369 RepID=UPI0024148C80|nr:taxadien-5-alpha-ol O-acetyltransferase-like [Cryptomeria japonica]GLJ55431.1 hypothetical protein SUGI_1190120 [Cryptomeria japonica]